MIEVRGAADSVNSAARGISAATLRRRAAARPVAAMAIAAAAVAIAAAAAATVKAVAAVAIAAAAVAVAAAIAAAVAAATAAAAVAAAIAAVAAAAVAIAAAATVKAAAAVAIAAVAVAAAAVVPQRRRRRRWLSAGPRAARARPAPERHAEILQQRSRLRLHHAGERRQGRVRPHLGDRALRPAAARRRHQAFLRDGGRSSRARTAGGQPAARRRIDLRPGFQRRASPAAFVSASYGLRFRRCASALRRFPLRRREADPPRARCRRALFDAQPDAASGSAHALRDDARAVDPTVGGCPPACAYRHRRRSGWRFSA